jgi:hypothetical protein
MMARRLGTDKLRASTERRKPNHRRAFSRRGADAHVLVRRVCIGLMTATALLGATTKVSSAPSEAPRADNPPAGIDAGFSSYVAGGRGAWIFAELGAYGWIAPNLALGGYVAVAVLNDPLDADCGANHCMTHEYKLGARLRFHLFPDLVVDPWAGVSAGGRLNTRAQESKTGFDVGALLGVDVRLDRFAFGPYGFVDQSLTKYNDDPRWDGQVGLGLHFDVKF